VAGGLTHADAPRGCDRLFYRFPNGREHMVVLAAPGDDLRRKPPDRELQAPPGAFGYPPIEFPNASGAADKIRTCYPRLRRPVLYPDELQPQT
jgi:hypothetical protein